MSASFISAMKTREDDLYNLRCELGYAICEEEEEEEVRCICSKCHGEGMCFVSKARAKELKEQELMEECCPYGESCVGDEEDDEEEEDEEEEEK